MSGVLRTVGVLMIQFRSWTMEITAELKFGATVCENGGHVASVCISTFTFGSPVCSVQIDDPAAASVFDRLLLAVQ